MNDQDVKKLPFSPRKQLFQEKLKELCDEYDIDLIPIITKFPAIIAAQLLFVDRQDKEMLNKLGLENKDDEMRLN